MARIVAVPTARPEWRTLRAAVFARDGGRCVRCKEPCASEDADVHHVMPRALGGADEPGNLVTLCDGCHAAHHPTLQVSLARRMIERWALRLARWLDGQRAVPAEAEMLGLALRVLGKKGFRPGQLDAVLTALRRQSLLMVSPTGSGKSLCYQLPAILCREPTVVLSPLKALMVDQVVSLQLQKVPATFINSSLTPREKALRFALLDVGAIKLLYCAPERFDPALVGSDGAARLSRLRPAFLVVDEAHCIDRWGDAFRPNYGQIAAIRRELGSPPVLAFTATAGVETQRRIIDSLGVADATVVVADVDRPNIALLRAHGQTGAAKLDLTAQLLSLSHGGRVMIFVPTRKIGEEVKAGLAARGHSTQFFHSKLEEVEKEFLLGRFCGRLEPRLRAIICTNAFGMGLDVPDVRLVIHWQAPGSVEDYAQEFGRAGRDGQPSVAVLFGDERDAGLHHFMLKMTVAAAQSAQDAAAGDARRIAEMARTKAAQIEKMNAMAVQRNSCFREQIRTHFIPPAPARRRPWSERLLGWLFGGRRGRVAHTACCDYCDDIAADRLVEHCRSLLGPS